MKVTNELFKQYVEAKITEEKLRDDIKALELKHLVPLKDTLVKVTLIKEANREKIIEEMKKISEKTHVYENWNITRTEKRTLQLVDHEKAIGDMFVNPDIVRKLTKLTGKSRSELKKALIVTELRRNDTLNLVSNLYKVDGILPKGFEEQVTEYLIVKEK